MPTVRANALGFYGGTRRRPGTVFVLADGDKSASWMDIVPDEEAPKAKPVKAPKAAKANDPKTLGDVTRDDAEAQGPALV